MQVSATYAAMLAAVAVLVACQPPTLSRDIKPVPTAAPAAELTNVKLSPIQLSRVVFNIPRGRQIGASYFDYFSCGGYDSGPVFWTSDRANGLTAGLADAFYHEMTAAHFNVVGNPEQMFATERERSDYLIGAQVTDLEINICDRVEPWAWQHLGRQRGEATVDVTWQVFSNREQRVVYTTKTRGYAKLNEAVARGEQVVFQDAFAAASANLSSDKGLVDLLRRDRLTARVEPAPVSDAAMKLESVLPLADQIGRNVPRIRDATATLLIGPDGHGSGFFVSEQGHLLTNYHVVGEGDTVPVRLSNGTTITGHVLRRNRVRDVALVKVDAVGTRALAIRAKPVAIGEEVYAIGTPLDRRLSNSLTRGIVNAVRQSEENGLELIQSDALIEPGNSGGPLLDASGNVVGISVSTLGAAPGKINFFIPIADALAKLRLEVTDAIAGAR